MTPCEWWLLYRSYCAQNNIDVQSKPSASDDVARVKDLLQSTAALPSYSIVKDKHADN